MTTQTAPKTPTLPETPTLIIPAGASRANRIQTLAKHIQATADQPMEPNEFVNAWVQHPLSQQRYRDACEQELAHAVGVGRWEIGWGRTYNRRPNHVPWLLRLANIVRLLQSHGICKPRVPLNWKPCTPLPPYWPLPLFQCDEMVSLTGGGFGTVRGFFYEGPHWKCAVLMHPESVRAGEWVMVSERELTRW